MKLQRIEILEKDTNKKGDLFGRLMGDLFHSLGYDEPRLNIHESGREIDLNSYHRTEYRIAIAECKAHSEKIGGADINKFVGAFDAEKRKFEKDNGNTTYSFVGYFISLSGFKETAIQQENDIGNNRIILLKPEKIVDELIEGRILVSIETAISSLTDVDETLSLSDKIDLLAYEKGWVWVIYYSNSQGQKNSHFALVHAEGKPLIRELADEIILLDNKANKIFDGLTLIHHVAPSTISQQKIKEAKNKYYKYLENELGEIQFEGLPTDKEAGSVKIKLENIFVPLHLTKIQSGKAEIESGGKKREGIGEILSNNTRLAILAKPGGGKSTLIKRIAIAYAFPSRRQEINDGLPKRDWFPVFLRCRELGEKVTLSITEIINAIPIRAEINSYLQEFSILASNSLQNGNALLLVDGLDEIAEDKNRIAFANQLRTFIATYPAINIIVTSRETGFRVVGGSLATYCEHYKLSNLIESEIEELTVKWHKAIIDDSKNTINEAKKLSELIINDNRIKVLAENPLLLTTLLFVRRWAGYLPTRRSVLYHEMIKLLLVTWNVEGHAQLDIEETEPQLAFVAYWMTKNGRQTITEDELKSCLIEARNQMPEILGYTNISPSDFIKRVESRSSLLIMSGHKQLASGSLTQIYEFLHLSFQEYLTAKAIVKRYIPKFDADQQTLDLIKPNINNQNWKEVIPLVAVLLERDAKELIKYLVDESKIIAERSRNSKVSKNELIPSLLGYCLANEVQINPELLGNAIEWYAKCDFSVFDKSSIEIILQNKFSQTFRQKVKLCFFDVTNEGYMFDLGSVLSEVFICDIRSKGHSQKILNEILRVLKTDNKDDKCGAILGLMLYAYSFPKYSDSSRINTEVIEDIYNELLELVKANDLYYNFCIFWSIAWSAKHDIVPDKFKQRFVDSFVKTWTNGINEELNRGNSWALYKLLNISIKKDNIIKVPNIKTIILGIFENPKNEFDRIVAIYIGYLLGVELDKTEITEAFRNEIQQKGMGDNNKNFTQFAEAMDIDLKRINEA